MGYNNVNNAFLKEIRGSMRGKGKFYFGSLKSLRSIIRDSKSEKNDRLNQILSSIRGNSALFFTKLNLFEINQLFLRCKFKGFLKTGDKAISSVELPCGSTLSPSEK